MATDNDWGDDFLDGDFDFDYDFDGNKDQGFLKSVSKGFFSSLKSNTVGDTDAKIKTLRRILPSSFGTTFNFYRDLDRRKKEAFKEFKENSAELMGDLAFLSGSLSESLRDRLPNKIVDGLDEFSKKDFSDWEKEGEYRDPGLSMESVTGDMEQQMLEALEAQSSITVEATDTMTRVMSSIGAKQLSAGLQNNDQLYEVNANLRRLYEYQMNVQAKREAMKLNLMTRNFLTSAKYYKFMEASQHRLVRELKDITKNTAMSEYEKTSAIQAAKSNIRDGILQTTLARTGGFGEALSSIISKDSVNEGLSTFGQIVGDLRFATEMSQGSGINAGEMIGSMLGQYVVEKGPEFLGTPAGKKMVNKLRLRYPEQAKKFDEMYKTLTEFGDTLSYSTKALGSVMGRHYQETGMMDLPDQTYEEYLEELPADKDPMPKALWATIRKATKAAGGAFNLIGENYQESQGSFYQIQEKSLASLKDVSVWSIHDSRSLTEEIPTLLSEIHNSIEKIRTGDDNASKLRYDYRTSRVTTTDSLNKQVERIVTPAWELNSYADTARSIAKDLDKDGTLSKEALDALSLRLARESDKGNIFNPYDYIRMQTDEYLNEDHAKEIDELMRSRFQIKEEDIARTQENTLDGLMARLMVPTAEGKELLHRLSERTESLKNYTPDVSKKIDLIRNLGLDEGLKSSGYVMVDEKTNKEYINQELIWKQLHNQITGKGLNLELPKVDIHNPTDTRLELGRRSRYTPTPLNNSQTPPSFSDGLSSSLPSLPPFQEEVSGVLSNIMDTLVEIQNNTKVLEAIHGKDQSGLSLNLEPMLDLMTTNNSTLAEISSTQLEQLAVLRKLKAVTTIGTEGLGDGEVTPEKQQEEKEKRSLIERLRAIVPADVFNKGVEALIANKPMVLGGLLGGLGVTAMTNPKAAALLAGGAAVATVYGKLNHLANSGSAPGEDEDLYDEEGNEVLYASKKNAGDYYDQASRKVIKSWKDVKGTVIDMSAGASEIAASAKRLGGKLFGPDGREVVLEGVHRLKAFVSKTYKAIDPVGKAKQLFEAARTEVDQLNVYLKGDSDPVLTRRGFKNGWYYDAEGNEIKGWRDIKGPVYDQNGDELISMEDLKAGLHTVGGVTLDSLSSAGKSFGKMLSKGSNWLQTEGRERLGSKILGQEVHLDRTGGKYEPITERLDSIYALVAKHWGYDDKIPMSEKVGPKIKAQMDKLTEDDDADVTPDKPGIRLNSLADKIRRKKEAKRAQFQDSVIDIADTLKPKDKDGKPKKDGGIFGSLLGMAGGGLFAMLKKFLGLGISGFSSMMKLNGTIAKGLFSLGKVLTGALLGKRAKDGVEDIVDGMDGSGERRKGGKGKRGRGRFPRMGKMGGMTKLGLGAGLMIGGDMALDFARDSLDPEEGSVTDKLLDYSSVGLDVAGLGMTASAIAGMAGTSLGGIAAAAAPLLLNPITLGVAGVGLVGYGAYKYFSSSDLTTQQKLRMAQYGIDAQHEELINEVLKLEAQLENYVSINGDQANFTETTPFNKILSPFFASRKTQQGLQDGVTWFGKRFKPVFLSYLSAMRTLNCNGFKEFDQSKNLNVAIIAKEANQNVMNVNPNPYRIQVWISPDVYALDYADTMAQVNRYLEEFKKDNDKTNMFKKLPEDLMIQNTETQIKENEQKGMLSSAWDKLTGNYVDQDKQDKLDTWFKQPEIIKDIDVSDMLPGDKPVAIITAFRLAAYGNDENMPWRVEGVLKLERWMESRMAFIGGKAQFTGTDEEFWKAFAMTFRITSKRGREMTLRWFNYRFLPVFTAWFETCRTQRGGVPSKVWRALSATAKFRFARRVSEMTVLIDERVRAVFEIDEAPFEGERSSGMSTKAKRLLTALEVKANEAKIKDPELERTLTQPDKIKDNSVYAPAPGTMTADPKANPDFQALRGGIATPEEMRNNRGPHGRKKREQQWARNQLSGELDQINVDTSQKYDAGAELKPGNDRGVSLNKDQMVKVLIQEMVKRGHSDPREIAEMLALTDYETGGYKATAENMRYSNAQRARNIFRKLKKFNIAQVEDLIRRGPVAFANAVYNGWLGNTDSENDGWLYRGRGLVQLTGKDNYEKAGADLGIDIVNNPRMVSEDPETMAKTAIWFYENNPQMRSIKHHGDFAFAARGLNGGKALPGMDKREALYNQYLEDLMQGELTKDMGTGEEEAPKEDMPALPEVPPMLAALPKERLEKEEKSAMAPKPIPKPSLDDAPAQATAAVKETKAPVTKTPTTPPQAPTLMDDRPLPDLAKAKVPEKLAPPEPVKVEADVKLKPETEAALSGQAKILAQILNAINEGNNQAARQRQPSVNPF
ncbi:phage endolysin [Vibrio phage pTD1]|uniref:Phage endolysin n=1 Tax=Vibrio phage pTD1 TaxID=1938577 RepID=A0A1Q2U373_9CAUD|nr:tail fiber protein [Vibrio phage pTD1]BAW98403.1 phage endolysin [Vibrio phage pTD1]